ncbi:RHS repeat-associated core domain-containing protein [Pseudomonas fluorescens]|uniref:RHS repeat-associated core domain-containing protein n=1 Tax=Pseudomonas fluorescens TaxID=294 RepID=UPI00278057C5|nr:RHS repeat-associated core domain-containing protein [Pseudomonas fluorescens]MDP9785795.1 RHS repeat-associated protein [Pseudomonas fluorescens]
MPMNQQILLCRYHYDPLDRLTNCTPSAQAGTQRFYLKDRLTSEIQGSLQRSILQQDDQILAQQLRQAGTMETTLLATDQQRSVLHALDATRPHPLVYTPYGHRPPGSGLLSLLGFNGERPDPVTGHYLLGNGYRAFNPALMRFNSPDSLSPFGEGGLNAYMYCKGDPTNRSDSTGHFPFFPPFKLKFWKPFSKIKQTRRTPATPNYLVGNYKEIEQLNLDTTERSVISRAPERQPTSDTYKKALQLSIEKEKKMVEKLIHSLNSPDPNHTLTKEAIDTIMNIIEKNEQKLRHPINGTLADTSIDILRQ